jgi:hypothetical protein
MLLLARILSPLAFKHRIPPNLAPTSKSSTLPLLQFEFFKAWGQSLELGRILAALLVLMS